MEKFYVYKLQISCQPRPTLRDFKTKVVKGHFRLEIPKGSRRWEREYSFGVAMRGLSRQEATQRLEKVEERLAVLGDQWEFNPKTQRFTVKATSRNLEYLLWNFPNFEARRRDRIFKKYQKAQRESNRRKKRQQAY